MNLVLPSLGLSRATECRVQPSWIATLGWLLGCAAFVAIAAASMPLAGWTGNVPI